MVGELRFRLLGGVEVSLAGESAVEALSSKALALLCYLVVTGRSHSRATLAGLLWGEKPEAQALTSLRQALAQLRRLFPAHLRVTRRAVAFDRTAPHWLDVAVFENKVREGREDETEHGITVLKEAIALYQGDFLEGFHVRDAPAFEEWAALQREYLRTRALEALYILTSHHTDRGEYEQALGYADRLIALDSWQEEAHRWRMLLLAHLGRYSEALTQYETCRHILREAFDVEPAAETQRLRERILAARQMHPHPLPPQPTPFVGREEELARLTALLANPSCRLLTLVGPGGIGKTRLGIQVAERMLPRFLHGVHFVPLETLPSASFLPSALLEALEIPSQGQTNPVVRLLDYLRDKEMLLVLDGFEQVLEGATLLAEILPTAPDVKFLVTSRERLDLRWEQVFPVKGLPVPPDGRLADLEAYAAVRLFLQSARRAHPGFTLKEEEREAVARICRLVGGTPLGVELAAAWVPTLSAREVLHRMERSLDCLQATARDIPSRHRSLRAVFESSWRLLSEQEQAILRRLSVFQGGFSEEAAWAVAGATPSLLAALEAKSLLRREGPGRYAIHETVREYAAEKLRLAGESAAVRDQHSAYFADLLNRVEVQTRRGQATERRTRELIREIDNIRAGWVWAVEHGRTTDIGRMLTSLSRLYEACGRFQEGLAMFREAIERLKGRSEPEGELIVGRLLIREGIFAHLLGEHETARRLLKEGMRIVERHGDRWEVALALNLLGILAGKQGNHEEARRLFTESLTGFRSESDPRFEAILLNNLGIAERVVGNYEQAEQFSWESLRISRMIGARRAEARALQNLALVAHGQKDYARAKRLHEKSLAILREEGDLWGTALALGNLGEAARLSGEYAEARKYLEESLSLRRQIGDRWGIAIALSSLGSLARAEGEYRLARQRLGEALQLALEVSAIPVALDTLVEFAEVLIRQGEEEKALEILALSLTHSAIEAWVREKAEALFREAASRVPPDVVAKAQRRGQSQKIEEVVENFFA